VFLPEPAWSRDVDCLFEPEPVAGVSRRSVVRGFDILSYMSRTLLPAPPEASPSDRARGVVLVLPVVGDRLDPGAVCVSGRLESRGSLAVVRRLGRPT